MPVTVKRGDKYPIKFTAASDSGPFDLTGATVRLLARVSGSTDAATELTVSSTDDVEGNVYTDDWGSLDVGLYDVELEVTTSTSDIITFPTDENGQQLYERLTVRQDLG